MEQQKDSTSKTKCTILLVDDDVEVQRSVKFFLEHNEYKVLVSNNGKEALDLLEKTSEIPGMIICDILMPVMGGYEFFNAISNNPTYYSIPFVFLTGKSAPDDIRLAKILGVDDYITKPFMPDDFLAIIEGKIRRSRRSSEISKKISVGQVKPFQKEASTHLLLHVAWDDALGPSLMTSYSPSEHSKHFLAQISKQLFSAASSIIGSEFQAKGYDILFPLPKLHQFAYLLFDSYPDPAKRARVSLFMLGVIAPRIRYIDTFQLKTVFLDMSSKIKKKQEWNFKEYFSKIQAIIP